MVRHVYWPIVVALPLIVQGRSVLEKRAGNVTTGVVCNSSFKWMFNSDNQSPCLVASALQAACSTGSWDVPVLGPADSYSFPNSSTANYCVCSWAVYNLLGACTVCQGSTHVDNWSPYITGCGATFATNTPFPTDKVIVPNNTLLPFWAATNPTQWTSGQFDSDQAKTINNEGKKDINLAQSNSSSGGDSSSSNAGPIAGGVIGGLAGLAAIIAVFLFLRRRRRRTKDRKRSLLDPLPPSGAQTLHGRSFSDTSQMKLVDSTGYTPDRSVTASPPSVYSNNTVTPIRHATSPSMNSLPYDVSIINGPASMSPSPPPPQAVAPLSPIGGGNVATQHNIENMIVPYTLVSPAQDALSAGDRKRADGNLYPIYESSNDYQGDSSNQAGPASRRRLNPPTYTESVTSGEASVIRSHAPSGSVDQKRRGGHSHQQSSDTVDSSTTNGRGNGAELSSTAPRRPQPRESGLSSISYFGSSAGFAGPGSVVAVGSAAIASPTDSQPGTNILSTVGSVWNGGGSVLNGEPEEIA